MRTLLVLRGAPGCGKSTFLKENDLAKFSISADEIRLMYSSPVMTTSGTFTISQHNNKRVFNLLFTVLEDRMKNGEFAIVDCTNSTLKEIRRYKKLAETYRYRMFVVDFTDIPIEECKRRNKWREFYKQVPDEVIDKMYQRFEDNPLPSSVNSCKPEEVLEVIHWRRIDFSDYTKIHHIGDIHGCYDALMSYMPKELPEDELFIFLGDYIDRGLKNKETLQYLLSICEYPNVILLEGNHEIHLWNYAHNNTVNSSEFIDNTIPQIQDISKSDIRKLYRKLYQVIYYKYNEKTVLCSHGGLPTLPEELAYVSTKQLIKGVGDYGDSTKIADNFQWSTTENTYQIHGHRNVENIPLPYDDRRTFNLEGAVEFGGNLRIVTLDKDGFDFVEIPNDNFRVDFIADNTKDKLTILMFVKFLREDKGIEEKQFGDISSFNFTRDTFTNRNWTPSTTSARGLFINTNSNEIVARSYDKFFNLNERKETQIDTLKSSMKFPVTAYVKENGYLGIVGYDSESDDLVFSSKYSLTSDHALHFKKMLLCKLVTKSAIEKLKNFLKAENLSLVFEVVDTEFDPHIIDYDDKHLYLLDAIKRQIRFDKLSYEELAEVANTFYFDLKTKAYVFTNPLELESFTILVNFPTYSYEGTHIEGFVLEDQNNFQVKVKTNYYKTWKRMRSYVNHIRNSDKDFDALNDPFDKQVITFMKSHPELLDKSILEIRKQFLDN